MYFGVTFILSCSIKASHCSYKILYFYIIRLLYYYHNIHKRICRVRFGWRQLFSDNILYKSHKIRKLAKLCLIYYGIWNVINNLFGLISFVFYSLSTRIHSVCTDVCLCYNDKLWKIYDMPTLFHSLLPPTPNVILQPHRMQFQFVTYSCMSTSERFIRVSVSFRHETHVIMTLRMFQSTYSQNTQYNNELLYCDALQT